MQFTLSYRLVLTPDEQALVDQYKLHDYPLTWRTIETGQVPALTLSSIVAGRSLTLGDVTTLVANEEIVKDACDSIPPLFDVVKTFGGDEVVEYPRSPV